MVIYKKRNFFGQTFWFFRFFSQFLKKKLHHSCFLVNFEHLAALFGLQVLGFGTSNVFDIPYVARASKSWSKERGNFPVLVSFLRCLQK